MQIATYWFVIYLIGQISTLFKAQLKWNLFIGFLHSLFGHITGLGGGWYKKETKRNNSFSNAETVGFVVFWKCQTYRLWLELFCTPLHIIRAPPFARFEIEPDRWPQGVKKCSTVKSTPRKSLPMCSWIVFSTHHNCCNNCSNINLAQHWADKVAFNSHQVAYPADRN